MGLAPRMGMKLGYFHNKDNKEGAEGRPSPSLSLDSRFRGNDGKGGAGLHSRSLRRYRSKLGASPREALALSLKGDRVA